MTEQIPSPGAQSEFLAGARDTIPLIVGAIPFGIIFGALATTAGLSWQATMGMSLFVFAGSSQFVAAGLVSQGAGVGIIVLTTFVVNLRHGLYAASIGPGLGHLSQRWILPLAFWLTDESYAVVVQRYRRSDSKTDAHWYYLGSAMLMYGNWQLCTAIGIVTGQRFSSISDWGLEFAMVVTFIGIVVPLLDSWAMRLCALVSAVVALLAHELPNHGGLMVASVAGIVTGILTRRWQRHRGGQ